MNFDCVGKDSKGRMYMKFHKPFDIVEKIQLLQRSILVNSFAYYEMNDNILSDFQYDANARQLEDLAKENPKEFARSRYYTYFHDFYDSEEHATSGFDLLQRVKETDTDLYLRIQEDAEMALKFSKKGN